MVHLKKYFFFHILPYEKGAILFQRSLIGSQPCPAVDMSNILLTVLAKGLRITPSTRYTVLASRATWAQTYSHILMKISKICFYSKNKNVVPDIKQFTNENQHILVLFSGNKINIEIPTLNNQFKYLVSVYDQYSEISKEKVRLEGDKKNQKPLWKGNREFWTPTGLGRRQDVFVFFWMISLDLEIFECW